jgi:hypothetical protein
MDWGINGWMAAGAAGVAAWYIFYLHPSTKPKDTPKNKQLPSPSDMVMDTHRAGNRGVQDMLAYNSMSQAGNTLLSLTPPGTTESHMQSYATTDYYHHQNNSGYLVRM